MSWLFLSYFLAFSANAVENTGKESKGYIPSHLPKSALEETKNAAQQRINDPEARENNNYGEISSEKAENFFTKWKKWNYYDDIEYDDINYSFAAGGTLIGAGGILTGLGYVMADVPNVLFGIPGLTAVGLGLASIIQGSIPYFRYNFKKYPNVDSNIEGFRVGAWMTAGWGAAMMFSGGGSYYLAEHGQEFFSSAGVFWSKGGALFAGAGLTGATGITVAQRCVEAFRNKKSARSAQKKPAL